ncbi:MAG TPA: glycoside hydrolase family 16 protein, partial [Fimbriimonas sp.]
EDGGATRAPRRRDRMPEMDVQIRLLQRAQNLAPDPRFWEHEVGYLRNKEAQYYTRDRRENARIENGRLVIEARKDNWEDKPITSASITTRGKKEFLYGRIEARAKVPTGRGTWPAVWTLGTNIREVGWPKCGEIDILENVGFDPSRVHANVHVDAYNHMKGTGKGASTIADKPWKDFHTYAVEWYPDRMEFFFDSLRYFVYRKERDGDDVWPFDKPQYLILNLAIGGAWGGQQGIDESLFPHRFEIDYVRYYKSK